MYQRHFPSKNYSKTSHSFPASFLWGASSSAFQVEGAHTLDGKGLTQADINAAKRRHIQADTSIAADFYHHAEEDIALMARLGLKTYRFSISWARIYPEGDGPINQAGLAFYDKVIDTLLSHNIVPQVTLYHFDLPYDLQIHYEGWTSRKTVDAYVRYAKTLFEHFGDRVKLWQTINEQNLMVRVDERMGIDTEDALVADRLRAQADYHMFLAAALATRACHELIPDAKIGPAISSSLTYPNSMLPEDVFAAKMNDYLKSDYALDMYFYGHFDGLYLRYLEERGILPTSQDEDEDILAAGRFDYLAVNYYRTTVSKYLPADTEHPQGMRLYLGNEVDFDQYGWCKDVPNSALKRSEYGAQIDPLGLRQVLLNYYQRYRTPLIVTENGLGQADSVSSDGKIHDSARIDYLTQHLLAAHSAIQDGVELIGYCMWSFTDLLSSHQGFKKRYGLVYIDQDDKNSGSLTRTPKDSYYFYQNVIASNGVSLFDL